MDVMTNAVDKSSGPRYTNTESRLDDNLAKGPDTR